MTQKAKSTAPNVHVEGSGNSLNFNIGTGSISSEVSVSWYQERMSAHRWFYWVLHAIVAIAGAAAWEFLRHFVV